MSVSGNVTGRITSWETGAPPQQSPRHCTVDELAGAPLVSMTRFLVMSLAMLWVVFAWMPSSAAAYRFSDEAKAACPACTTPTGQAQAAELVEGLTINGVESPRFGPTIALAEDAAAAGPDVADGVGRVVLALVVKPQPYRWPPLAPTAGVVVGTFAAGFIVGTAGRALAIKLFGGDNASAGTSESMSWSNARWHLCTDEPSCVTTLYSSAWHSPVIPRGNVYVAWEDGWSSSTNVSAEHTTGTTGCPPYGDQCEPIEYGSFGPQSGDLDDAQSVLVYGVGTNERPGHVFTQSLSEMLAESPAPRVVDAADATAPPWENLGEAEPRARDELLKVLDDVIQDNPGFGGWVEDQLGSNPVVPDCNGLTVAVCQGLLPGGSSVTIGSGDASDPDAVITHQDVEPGAAIESPTAIEVDTAPWTAVPPTPYPASYTDDADEAAERIKITNPNIQDTYSDQEVDVIAKSCVWIARAASVSSRDCASLPVLVAGRGDFPEATNHIIRGIEYHPLWFKLRYYQRPDSERSWKNTRPETDGGAATCVGEGSVTACDEYPFFRTEQGALGDSMGIPHGKLAHLKIIDYGENSGSGNRYGQLVVKCEMQLRRGSTTHGSGHFLVVPTPAPIPTFPLCNGPNPSG